MSAVDTNVFIYAVDSSERLKGPVALALLDRLSAEDLQASPTLMGVRIVNPFHAV
ncbi:MAG: hypothetical protein IH988_03905 [Planctomycetes bacterium]|nr:hypothetical protein [Planctomycetota bacterium]